MKTYQFLGYAGLIPFVIFLGLFQYSPSGLFIEPLQAFTFYSAMIFSFIAGTLWRSGSSANYKSVQVISNLFCLYAFVCLFLSPFYALLFLSFGYLVLFLAEYLITTTHTNNDINNETQNYLKMRFKLTIAVNILHSVAIVFLL